MTGTGVLSFPRGRIGKNSVKKGGTRERGRKGRQRRSFYFLKKRKDNEKGATGGRSRTGTDRKEKFFRKPYPFSGGI